MTQNKKIVIVMPNCLFEKNNLIDKNTIVYLLEHPQFFTAFNYHKLKLILHRASMKNYFDFLKKKYNCRVKYIEFNEDIQQFFKKEGLKNLEVKMHDCVDHMVMKDLKKKLKKLNIKLIVVESPLFITKVKVLAEYAGDKKTFFHHHFYKFQRKKHDILIKNKKPVGGKWSFDSQNKEPFPDNFKNNYKPKEQNNKYIKEAKKYINKYFKKNPGSDNIYFPIDHDGTKKHFDQFLKKRLSCFGPYQDAQDKNIPFGCHSLLSPMMNIGLITPKYVIQKVEEYGMKNDIKISSIEGFIRQILGWREAMRLIYMFKRREMEKENHFDHKKKLDKKIWYYGKDTTGFPVIDDLITKSIKYGYLHHIERLMYVGNFLLISQTKPEDVFDWFMSMFVDAYNWVMYGNVFAMTQYSTGKLLMTRPYFSSSNYIDNMSSYKKHKDKYNKIELKSGNYEWFDVWDAIYYNFISKNRKEFKKNYAIAAQVRHWDKKKKSEQQELKKIAKEYFDKY